MMMQGDVTVVGLDVSTTVLYDIGMDVPHRQVVTIPANKATMSKDLWRAISQRRVFQLHAGSVSQGPVRPTVAPSPPAEVWQDKCRQLEAENAQLREAVARMEQDRQPAPVVVQAAPDERLDQILNLLKAGVPVAAAAPGQSVRTVAPAQPTVVDVDVPAFIPTEIKPKGIEGRIAEVQAETSDRANLGSAADALRKMRQGRQ